MLAHWRYTLEEWHAFVGQEGRQLQKGLRSVRYFIAAVVVTAAVAVASLLLIPTLALGGRWDEGVWGPPLGVAVVAGLLLAVALALWATQKRRLSRLNAGPGDVIITPEGVDTNGVWFGWKGAGSGWRLRHIGRKTVPAGDGKSLEVLEFKCAARNEPGRNLSGRVVKAWRVPVPRGKEAEADRIARQLLAAQNFLPEGGRADLSSSHAGSDALGHDFAGDVCRRCGTTAEAASGFNWACKG
jgi:hypothetical protein